ncbi:MAG: phosphate/phosphite/phosphonate ABC transporter substrate-binding protein [Paracoccaceae bacterium]
MYTIPATVEANDAFWDAIRANLGFGPMSLTKTSDLWSIWQSPDLLFSQTCGYPFRAKLANSVQLVGTPDYQLSGCAPGHYYSVILARDAQALSSMQTPRFAYNEALSQSGWAAPVQLFQSLELGLAGVLQTGSHAASARAVRDGLADLAGLDVLTYQMLKRHSPDDLNGLKIIATTDPTPTLPYITSLGQNASQLATALKAAIRELTPAYRHLLHLHDLVQIPASAYLALPSPAAPSAFNEISNISVPSSPEARVLTKGLS